MRFGSPIRAVILNHEGDLLTRDAAPLTTAFSVLGRSFFFRTGRNRTTRPVDSGQTVSEPTVEGRRSRADAISSPGTAHLLSACADLDSGADARASRASS